MRGEKLFDGPGMRLGGIGRHDRFLQRQKLLAVAPLHRRVAYALLLEEACGQTIPEGRIRYLISKSITNAQRVATQVRYLGSAGPNKAWEGRDGRLFVPQMALRELHECSPKKRRNHPAGRRGSGHNTLQQEEPR